MAIYIAPSIVIATDDSFNSDNGVIGIHQLVTTSTVTSDTAAAGYPVTNLANDATDLEWNASSTATQYVTVDVSGYGDLIDYMGLAGHNLGSSLIPFSVEANSGSGFVEIIPSKLAVTDDPIILRWTPAIYTAVRLKLWTGGTAAARIGSMYVGKLLNLQRRIYVDHTPITYGYQQNATNGQSESGNFLGRIVIGASNQTTIALSNLTAAWYRAYFAPFIVLARTKPFFFAWRPTSYPLEVGYVWLTAMPMPANALSNGMMKVSLSVRGIVS